MSTPFTYDYALMHDQTAGRMSASGASDKEIIATLVWEKEILMQRFAEVSLLVPFKVTLPDGTVKVWRCPDHLIPDHR